MDLRMPKLGMEMTEGVLSRWLVDDLAHVEEGQAIYEVETDKAENEIAAPAAGTLHQHARTGGTYEVGTLLGSID
jgi:pyruvate/2-oxoglutarate dehydrogenase complex dihydrolipoamide acyltransferase (E2) component